MTSPDDNIKDERVAQSLVQEAKRIFQQRFGREGELEAELADLKRRPFGIQQRALALETKIKAKGAALKRLRDFQPLSGGEFRCPKCWLDGFTASVSERRVGHYRFSYQFVLTCSRCRDIVQVA